MADQIERLIEAVKAVSSNIQRTQTYKDGNIFRLATDVVVEVAGLSVIEASTKSLEVSTELIADDTAATTTADGILDSQPGLGSSANEVSGVAGSINVLKVATKLRGTLIAETTLSGRVEGTSRYIVGDDTAGAGGADAIFKIMRELVGVIGGNSPCVAHDFHTPPSNP